MRWPWSKGGKTEDGLGEVEAEGATSKLPTSLEDSQAGWRERRGVSGNDEAGGGEAFLRFGDAFRADAACRVLKENDVPFALGESSWLEGQGLRYRHRETYLELYVEERYQEQARLLLQEALGLFPPPEIEGELGVVPPDEVDAVACYDTEGEMAAAQEALHAAGIENNGVRRTVDAAVEYVLEVHPKDRDTALVVLERLLERESE